MDELDGPEALVEHLKECRQVDAAIVADGNADELLARLIGEGWTYDGVEYVAGKRVRYLVPPPGVLLAHKDEGNWPPPEDELDCPDGLCRPGHHTRELTEDGHPLMGSSPAEREEAAKRAERIRQQAMRDHPFVGEGIYCEARITTRPSGSDEVGWVSGWVGCGYGRDTHPEDPTPDTEG